jgi:hypothetical protein
MRWRPDFDDLGWSICCSQARASTCVTTMGLTAADYAAKYNHPHLVARLTPPQVTPAGPSKARVHVRTGRGQTTDRRAGCRTFRTAPATTDRSSFGGLIGSALPRCQSIGISISPMPGAGSRSASIGPCQGRGVPLSNDTRIRSACRCRRVQTPSGELQHGLDLIPTPGTAPSPDQWSCRPRGFQRPRRAVYECP